MLLLMVMLVVHELLGLQHAMLLLKLKRLRGVLVLNFSVVRPAARSSGSSLSVFLPPVSFLAALLFPTSPQVAPSHLGRIVVGLLLLFIRFILVCYRARVALGGQIHFGFFVRFAIFIYL
jgi:hypothetical protein